MATTSFQPRVSVLVPTFDQAHFIARALASLQAQTLDAWEAVVVDDGSRDATAAVVAPFLDDARIRYLALDANEGLGRALNVALDATTAPLVAYLPADDVFYPRHLETLAAALGAALGAASEAVLAVSGVRWRYNREAEGPVPGEGLQLVQAMHRRTGLRWTERAALESDDLDRLYWSRLQALGASVGTGVVTCEWVDHPRQRHKLMREPAGGINPFRRHYRVRAPLRFHTRSGNAIDEVALYRRLRERPPTPRAADGLTILLVGELAYNAERVLALEEQGHTLYGLWTDTPYWFNTVGPLPFGHVEDLPRDDWRAALRRLRPNVIYAQLNWQAVPFCHDVLLASSGIPFVWHFKEGPFICLEQGTWPQLLDLYRMADGRIFSCPEARDWFELAAPGLVRTRPCHVLDGDLPRRDWFDGPVAPPLSAAGGDVHTVVPGRPIGLHPPTVAALAAAGIHLHFYGDYTHGQWREWIAKTQALAPHHLHLHGNVAQDRWVEEFSRYDAGWLHCFASRNGGDLRRADWDDLNLPARIATLAAAGLPLIQRDNGDAVVAAQALARRLGVGVFYDGIDDLAAQLRDGSRMGALRTRMWAQREQFCFDTHVPDLVAFFRHVIATAGRGPRVAG
ncbi:glycosyltransferase [Massilia sp. CT11-137]|uniref:glycosyltransferase n=1 Tax=Massilia sp. CT11-137 TaxID=3393901 RepID=UPI0039A64199